jgi:PBSX family phage portal protein
MPIRIRVPSRKTQRTQRGARNLRFINVEQKGATAEFGQLLETKVDLNAKQVPDPFNYILSYFVPVAGLSPIVPIYAFEQLANLCQKTNALRACIDSYVTNIDSYGHVLTYVGPPGKQEGKEQVAEKVMLESFLSCCAPDLTVREVRERARWDKETLGNCFFEISRNQKGQVVLFDHIPGITMRRTRREQAPTEVIIETPNPADPSQIIKKTAYRYFCRYVQIVYGPQGYRKVFFKEFGDPRPINPSTGEVDYTIAIEDQATEVMMLQLYTPGSVYGLPRWIGQLPSILGSREAEMVNLNFFKENAIPAMMVLISGGALTAESFQVIEDYIHALKGQKAMHRILVLEASADDTTGSTEHSLSAPKIDMKPMVSERQVEGLFKDYDQANMQKVRGSFRLPPIFAGRAEDYTRASAIASMITAEEQIFAPEREFFDDFMNNKILKTYQPKYWKYKSMGAPIADPDSLSKLVQALDDAGAMTPNNVIKIANQILDIEIDPITAGWGDYPFQAVVQYIIQGKEVKGLTKFIVDMQAEMDKESNAHNNAMDLASAQPIISDSSTAVTNKPKKAPNDKPANPNGPPKNPAKPAPSKKAANKNKPDGTVNLHSPTNEDGSANDSYYDDEDQSAEYQQPPRVNLTPVNKSMDNVIHFNRAMIQRAVRREMRMIIDDLQDAVVAQVQSAVQVPARK